MRTSGDKKDKLTIKKDEWEEEGLFHDPFVGA